MLLFHVCLSMSSFESCVRAHIFMCASRSSATDHRATPPCGVAKNREDVIRGGGTLPWVGIPGELIKVQALILWEGWH